MQAKLKRSIGVTLLTLYGLGTILGAGIYVLIGKVALVSGFYAPLAFLVAAILAGFSGYSYAVLSARYPKSAGEAVYIQAAFQQNFLSSTVGWLVVLTGVVSAAAIAKGFVGYLNVFIELSDFIVLSVAILLLCGLACWGVQQSVMAASFVTALEIAGLILVVALAGDALVKLPEQLGGFVPEFADGQAWFAVVLGAFIAFYAFIGFEDMVNMAEEVKEPQKNLPRAIIAALIISALLYLLVAFVAMLSLPLAELQGSRAPMTDILKGHSQKAAVVISVISMIAVINGALVQIIMGARVLYGMGSQQLAFSWLGQVHAVTQTPILATCAVSFVVWLLAVVFPLMTLAKITSFIIIVVFLLMHLSLLKLIRDENTAVKKSFKVQVWVPVCGAVMCLLFLVVQVYQLVTQATVATH